MTTEAEGAPICVAFPTIMDGLVLRWYFCVEAYQLHGEEMISASRNGVRVRTFLHKVPAETLAAATRAFELISTGCCEEAAAMATHRAHLLGRELTPIQREATDA